MHWFRKTRYVVALLAILFTAISFSTQIEKHSAQYVISVYALLSGMFVLTLGLAYADRSVTEWLS